MKLGDIVYSKAGRDQGRTFVVVDIVDENFVKIADGDLRRIKTAKLKKIMHLRHTGDRLEKIATKLENGTLIFDKEIFSALRFYNER